MKKLTSIILTLAMLVVLIQTPLNADAKDDFLPKEVLSYMEGVMEEIKYNFGTECSWDSNTSISRFYIVNKSTNIPYSIICELETFGKPCGYVEFLYDLSLILGFSFGGSSTLTSMLEYRGYNPEKYKGYTGSTVYLCGAFNYAIEKDSNNVISLNDNSVLKKELHREAERVYLNSQLSKDSLFDDLEYSSDNFASYAINQSNPYLTTAQLSTLGVVIMSDFSGYSNHCTPTAGVNFIRYWYKLEGKSGLWLGSNSAVFSSLYNAMATNGNGTSFVQNVSDNGYAGLRSYAINRRCSPDSKDIEWAPTLSEVKSQINSGHILMFTTSNYNGCGSYHTVVCTGYTDSSTVQILNGWNRSPEYRTYSMMAVCDYYYIAYD